MLNVSFLNDIYTLLKKLPTFISMKFRYQKPHPSLSAYLRTVLAGDNTVKSVEKELPVFSNGMPALFCRTEKDAKENERVVKLVIGNNIPAGYWVAAANTTIIAYFFKPFALASMFNVAAAELKEPVELNTIMPHETNALRTQLAYAATTKKKTGILDNLLVQQLQQHERECMIIQYATDKIMLDPAINSLAAILKELSLTERTFQRIFKKYVGITFSQYRRICQFQLSFTQVRTKSFDKLTDVAFDNGFADQSHFIRSFKEFTELTPKDYLKRGLKGKKR
jgi:AraC-like DNA-binding protein